MSDSIAIENVRRVGVAGDRWCGTVQIAGEDTPRHILIFRRGRNYTAIPAACPHEGYRLDECPVDETGQIFCPAHGQSVRVEGGPTAMPVTREGRQFTLTPTPRCAPGSPEELQRLRDEVEALREANATLEHQIVTVSEQMEAMVRELSDKSRALEQVAGEQQRMSAFVARVMDTMDSLVLLLDRSGRIQRTNPAVERLLGYGSAELIGSHADMLLAQSDIDALRANTVIGSAVPGTALFRTFLARGRAALELNLCARDGSRPSLLLHGAPLHDMTGKLEGVVVVGSDVTRLRSREQALIESEQRFRDYSDIASDWLWETDAELRFKPLEAGSESEDPLRREMHRKYQLVVGRRTEEIAHPDDLRDAEKWSRYHAARAQRLEYRDFELRIRPPGGQTIWLSTSGKPMFGPNGEFRGYRGIAKDISARKEIEAELRRHRDHLSDLVAEQTADLVRARDAAEQASRMKSEFLANISHELRTPLHGVLSFANIGMQRAATALPEKLHNYFDRIRLSGERLTALVDDLLDLARLESGRASMNLVPTDIVALERGVRQSAEALLASKHLRVVVDAQSPDTKLAVDAVRLNQVLLNLLSNAIKFSPEHSVLTWIFADDTVELDGGASRAALRVTLEDQGVGIPEAELESIFDKFVQSSKTKSGAGGTGLGLAICREIVHAHGGRIRARNNPAGGAAFDVLLPHAQGVHAAPDDAQRQ